MGDGGKVRILFDIWMLLFMFKLCVICDCSILRIDIILFVIYIIKIYRNNIEML